MRASWRWKPIEQLKEVTKIVSQEESSGELSSRSSVSSLQRLRKLLVKLVLLGSHSTTTESEVEGSSGEAGSSWPGADDTTSAGFTTVAKTVGGLRPSGIAKNSATTEASSGEAGPSWPGADGTIQRRRYSSR